MYYDVQVYRSLIKATKYPKLQAAVIFLNVFFKSLSLSLYKCLKSEGDYEEG